MPQSDKPNQAAAGKAAPPAKVADAMAATMKAYGMEFAFGIPGNDVLELVRACGTAGIEFVVAKSEPSAAFMAEAVSQVSGAPAACIFALGPGISNGVSGVAGAMMERAPVVVLGGEMAGDRRGIYNHQVMDHVAALTPVTKYAAELNPARAGQIMAKALDIATAHPAGPVFLNCPADATRADGLNVRTFSPSPVHHGVADAARAGQLRDRLAAAKQPLALIGRGALQRGLTEPVRSFIEAWQMPFLATYKVKGIVPETSPLCLGAVALSPVVDELSLKLVKQADLLVLIGFDPIELRDAWLDAWPADKPVVSLDWAPQQHRIFPVGDQVIGDIGGNLSALMPQGGGKVAARWDGATISAHRQAVAHVVRPRSPKDRISPAALFGAVSKSVTPELLMSIDVGAHRILANHVIECLSPGQLLQSNGLGCMGYAIPAAIGATLAARRGGRASTTVAMLGDGCALMSLGELALVAELELPIVTVILNDASLALIELKQSKMDMGRQGVGFRSPNFAALAEGFGMTGTRVTSQAQFEAALKEALANNKCCVIEAMCDPSEYWEQM